MTHRGNLSSGSLSKEYQKKRDGVRVSQKRVNHRVKLRQQVGVLDKKSSLKLGLLNVDGLSSSSLEDIQLTLQQKSLDVCIILETKRRQEEFASDISIPGYNVKEIRRSDAAGDKGGGGLAYYTRQSDGILFKEYSPPIADPALHYVRTERFWLTADSLLMKTAVCGTYLGCQYPDDRNQSWNQGLLQVLQSEAVVLRAQGYRLVMLGDFNCHIGSTVGVGVPGNHPDVNLNGDRFLRFLREGDFCHINGVQNLTVGTWTRQRGGSKSILDFGVISNEHLSTVRQLFIDERGVLGGGSDHNFLILTLNDEFVRNRRLLRLQPVKKGWNCMDDIDWEPFQSEAVLRLGSRSPETLSVDDLASQLCSALLAAGDKGVGRGPRNVVSKGRPQLPRPIVTELQLKRNLERAWKSRVADANTPVAELAASETAFLEQKTRVNDLLFAHKNRNRARIKEMCSGNSTKARKHFWSIVSTKVKQSSDISAVVNPATGVLKCGIDDIKSEVEEHLCRVFSGSMEPLGVDAAVGDPLPPVLDVVQDHDHPYGVHLFPKLPNEDSSASLLSDPAGWTNRTFSFGDVKRVIKSLKGGKSSGWDSIPNEFLIHSPDLVFSWIVVLFNKIKSSGVMPRGWCKGRITLIHKSGLREVLSNYRPITVIISLCGLFSKLLNERLTEVVETHRLLGEVQNGFRKERQMADNSFILDSILMKAKSSKKRVHLCYVDISKAYDSVNRQILWKKLQALGFSGEFLGCIKALYAGDSVDVVVNGLSTRAVFPGRGLRQGCSLSPLLFALYISDIGSSLSGSAEGFQLGGLVFSILLFADDIVLISCSFTGLESLIALVQGHCEKLKLVINPSKSKIVTPDDVDQVVLLDDDNQVVLSLAKVLSYKYLGTETTLLMSSTGSKRQQRCLATAKRYKFGCFYVGRTGPDVIDTVLATWTNIAIPSMISGCEVIPFTETTIESIERIQSQLAKHVLGLPQSAPNICAQTVLGLKPFRMVLYQHQLSFYTRVMNLPSTRWVRSVLSDHLNGDWISPYIVYIAKIRQKLQLLSAPPSIKFLKTHLNSWFLDRVNRDLSQLSLHCVSPIKSFTRARYVRENDGCYTLAAYLLNSAGLGNRAPRAGRQRTGHCSLCNAALTEVHVAFLCPGMDDFRYNNTDIMVFIAMCRTRGTFPSLAYKWYVTGLDWNGVAVAASVYLKRGRNLQRISDEWLRRT